MKLVGITGGVVPSMVFPGIQQVGIHAVVSREIPGIGDDIINDLAGFSCVFNRSLAPGKLPS